MAEQTVEIPTRIQITGQFNPAAFAVFAGQNREAQNAFKRNLLQNEVSRLSEATDDCIDNLFEEINIAFPDSAVLLGFDNSNIDLLPNNGYRVIGFGVLIVYNDNDNVQLNEQEIKNIFVANQPQIIAELNQLPVFRGFEQWPANRRDELLEGEYFSGLSVMTFLNDAVLPNMGNNNNNGNGGGVQAGGRRRGRRVATKKRRSVTNKRRVSKKSRKSSKKRRV